MRIVHADTDDLDHPLRGGQPVRTYAINARLTNRDDITVFTSTWRGAPRRVVRDGIRYERLGVTIPHWGLSSHLTFLARLPAAIRRTPHDLVVEEFTPPFGFCDTGKHTSAPVVSIVQWFFFDQWTRRYRLQFEDRMRKRARLGGPRHLIVQTARMGAYFRELLPDADIYTIPCGIDHDAFQAPRPDGSFVLFLGRLDIAHKGLDDLLAAWARIARAGVVAPLWIAGAGPDRAQLESRVEALGLGDRIVFKGRLEGEDKRAALRSCRFVVMPSREETFGIAALEAMASGKTVVAYDIEHLDELLRPAWSATVPKGDVSALADAIAAHWLDPTLCTAQGLRAAAAARLYEWDVLAERQRAVYAELIESEGPT